MLLSIGSLNHFWYPLNVHSSSHFSSECGLNFTTLTLFSPSMMNKSLNTREIFFTLKSAFPRLISSIQLSFVNLKSKHQLSFLTTTSFEPMASQIVPWLLSNSSCCFDNLTEIALASRFSPKLDFANFFTS